MTEIGKLLRRAGVIFCTAILLSASAPADVRAADRNFNKHSEIALSGEEDFSSTGQFSWIKYRAAKDGYVTITAAGQEPASAGTLQLYDKAKAVALTEELSYDAAGGTSGDMVCGVKKNGVYFLRVNAQGAVTIRCQFRKISENSGSKKAKAKAVTKNKTVKGVIAAGDGAADWYKVKVKKKQILHFYYSGGTSGQICFTFSGTYLQKAVRTVDSGSAQIGHAYTNERVQPGTYYVKVSRGDASSSGYYTLMWE